MSPVQARDESLSMGAKVGSLKEDLRALWAMLGKGSEEEATVAESLAGKPLRVQVTRRDVSYVLKSF